MIHYLSTVGVAHMLGVSESSVRYKREAKRDPLPRPDATDETGRPLWLPRTIAAWTSCEIRHDAVKSDGEGSK